MERSFGSLKLSKTRENNGKEQNVLFIKNGKERNIPNGKERGAQPWDIHIPVHSCQEGDIHIQSCEEGDMHLQSCQEGIFIYRYIAVRRGIFTYRYIAVRRGVFT